MTIPSGRLPPGAWVPRILESDDNAACPTAVLMRRDALQRLGGFEESFRGTFSVVEDQATWFKISVQGPFYFSPEPLFLYRIHPDSCCGRVTPSQMALARVKLYHHLVTLLRECPAPRPEYGFLLRMAQCRLCEALLQARQHSAEEAEFRTRFAELKRAVGLTSFPPGLLGWRCSGTLLLGAISPTRALESCQKQFRAARRAYDDAVNGNRSTPTPGTVAAPARVERTEQAAAG
jgi:hypothetical protein